MNKNLETIEAVNTHGISIKYVKNKRFDICNCANVVCVVQRFVNDS